MSILLAATLCLVPPTITGFSNPPTVEDTAVLKSAIKRCPELYKDSPCVSSITKLGDHNYRVMCGDGKKKA